MQVLNPAALRSRGEAVNAGGVCLQEVEAREGFSLNAKSDSAFRSQRPHLWLPWPSESFLENASGF